MNKIQNICGYVLETTFPLNIVQFVLKFHKIRCQNSKNENYEIKLFKLVGSKVNHQNEYTVDIP